MSATVLASPSSNESFKNVETMSAVGDWPSLEAAHGLPTSCPSTLPAAGDDEWEMLSPNESGVVEDTDNDGAVEVVISKESPRRITRMNSQSAPDLRELEESALLAEAEREEDDQTDASPSVVMVSNPASVADSTSPWSSKNKVSFKDAILSPSKAPSSSTPDSPTSTPKAVPRVKNKVKTRYVVTPIQRCAKSTGDLLSLAANYDEEHEGDHEDLGATDAMEYYNRKSHGAHGRTNAMKIRPDEAKRKQMIVHKKNLQRAKQKK